MSLVGKEAGEQSRDRTTQGCQVRWVPVSQALVLKELAMTPKAPIDTLYMYLVVSIGESLGSVVGANRNNSRDTPYSVHVEVGDQEESGVGVTKNTQGLDRISVCASHFSIPDHTWKMDQSLAMNNAASSSTSKVPFCVCQLPTCPAFKFAQPLDLWDLL